MPIVIERGHPTRSAGAPGRRGHECATIRKRQVHKKPLVSSAGATNQPRRARSNGNGGGGGGGGGGCGKRQTLSHATTHHVWLLSIMSLILITMLAGDCEARTFLASSDMSGSALGDGSDSLQQVGTGDKYYAPSGAALEYAVEMSCRNLVGSLLSARLNRDLRGAADYLDYSDVDRLKRASPKHTPRFGR